MHPVLPRSAVLLRTGVRSPLSGRVRSALATTVVPIDCRSSRVSQTLARRRDDHLADDSRRHAKILEDAPIDRWRRSIAKFLFRSHSGAPWTPILAPGSARRCAAGGKHDEAGRRASCAVADRRRDLSVANQFGDLDAGRDISAGEFNRSSLTSCPSSLALSMTALRSSASPSTISPLRMATTLPSLARAVENDAAEADFAANSMAANARIALFIAAPVTLCWRILSQNPSGLNRLPAIPLRRTAIRNSVVAISATVQR